ncbi:beta-1,3-galactosyltransferase 4-like [Sphaerodactylus townsendi]|uniref:beta-1,3-galactosyltransferase 4-like n=1 Tax=Sphaerodactylus townsendi TaxID=933632 RepID=UPI0020268D5A|nr:beta-1,3-galactosyltransferase 4-like [Sphaerodactylus townsendi]
MGPAGARGAGLLGGCRLRCRRRVAAGLLAGLVCLSAAAFLCSGGHEELFSRALPLWAAAGGGGPPAAPPAPPPPPRRPAEFALEPPPPPACAPPTGPRRRRLLLLSLVVSATDHAEQRQAVRATWGGVGGSPPGALRTFFVVGLPGDPSRQAALEEEARQHGDLIQGRFVDTYANLTLKTLALLGWAASRCPAAAFVLKVDDDVFMNLPALAAHLDALRDPWGLYLGRIHWRVRPDRNPASRHHVPAALYPGDVFPPYCSGTAYVLSGDAVAAVLDAARHVPLVPVEDAFVGLCAWRAGITPRHVVRMAGSTHFPADPCCYREVLFSVHDVAAPKMVDMWQRAWRQEAACTFFQRAFGILRCRILSWMEAGL